MLPAVMTSPHATQSAQPANARHVAMRFVAEQIRRWPDLDLRPLATAGLDERDARLAQAICAETVRRWLTLQCLLNARLRRPLVENEINLQAALLVGAAQIFFLSHQPDYAVVNETVAWAKRRVRPKAGGLVNAVLRRMIDLRGEFVESRSQVSGDAIPLSDGRWLALTDTVLPEDPVERLATQTSHPVELIARWTRRYAPAELERLALHSLVIAPTLIVGLPSDVVERHDDLAAHDAPGFAVWSGSHAGLVELLGAHRDARVQDPMSFDAVRRVREATGDAGVIADVCAGSGTKTAHLALAYPEAKIIATDIDQRRFSMLHQRFADWERVEVVEPDRLMEFAGKVDLLLLDVPCSNSGTLARRVEARYRVDTGHLASLVALQKQVVADHLALRGGKGIIAYSTCSLEPEENEAQSAWINRWHRTRVVTEFSQRPAGMPGDSPAGYRDGGYLALLC